MTTQTLSPPELETMRIEIDGEIGTLTLDRPDVFNAMSPQMIGEFTVAFAWLADRAPLRALIITGAGKAFCSGGDVGWFRKGVESEDFDLPSDVRRGAEVLHQAIIDLRRIPFPVIAAINGPAAGAGFSLALACDTRIASENAFFACAYGRIGASPDGGMTYFLPRVVGPSRALEIMLEDPNMSAADALGERLVSRGGPRRSADGPGPRGGRGRGEPRRPTTCGWRSCSAGRASRTASPTTSRWSATESPTAWAPRTCAPACRHSSPARSRSSPVAEPRLRAGRIRLESRPEPMKGPSMKKAFALLPLAAASVALVACGGSSSSTDTSASSGGGGGTTATVTKGSTVKLTANANNQLSYDQKTLNAKSGTVSIDFDNPASLQHDVAVADSSGKVLGTSDLVAQGKVNLTLSNLKPGKYTFYCTVPGHRDAGMQGTLNVS